MGTSGRLDLRRYFETVKDFYHGFRGFHGWKSRCVLSCHPWRRSARLDRLVRRSERRVRPGGAFPYRPSQSLMAESIYLMSELERRPKRRRNLAVGTAVMPCTLNAPASRNGTRSST